MRRLRSAESDGQSHMGRRADVGHNMTVTHGETGGCRSQYDSQSHMRRRAGDGHNMTVSHTWGDGRVTVTI